MQNEVQFAGFGGQGIMLMGQILAEAAMQQGYEVVWIPSYGPEMRCGTCNCTVVVSDKPVGSPVIRSPRAVLAMNLGLMTAALFAVLLWRGEPPWPLLPLC